MADAKKPQKDEPKKPVKIITEGLRTFSDDAKPVHPQLPRPTEKPAEDARKKPPNVDGLKKD